MRLARLGRPEVIALAGAGLLALRVGWFAAVLGCILECAGGAMRAGTTDRPRKPPGVL